MDQSTIGHTVAAFRALHARERLLALPNAWDAASAAIARSTGAEAIATTSAGVAWTCGYPDGNAIPHDVRLFAIRAVLRGAGTLPVTIDFEAGYSDDPASVAESVRELRALGVVGINLEDGADSPELLERKIVAIKRALQANGDDIFINARTDVYLLDLATGEGALRETIERAKRYEAAGADGIFVPYLRDSGLIAKVASATALPLNIFPFPGMPSQGELHALGVRRLSAGSTLAELAYGTARHAARAFLSGDASALFSNRLMTYPEMNAFFGG